VIRLAALIAALAAGPALARDLPAAFDCVRERGGIVAAHRGGGGPGQPENVLSTARRTVANVTPLIELDVSTTSDGVLVLFHDDELDEDTNGKGEIAQTPWRTVRALRLKDPQGRLTRERPSRLSDTLAALKGRAIIQLDRKRPAQWSAILAEVDRAGARDAVVPISYSIEEALEIARLAPWAMVSATIRSQADLDTLAAGGLPPERILAWTGAGRPNPELWAMLRARGVEPIFGTLGRVETRLDTQYAADGDPSEYRDLLANGVDIISSSTPAAAAGAIAAQDARACLAR
jgi:glycerophosphoryl diester phosphodiesterase